MTLHDGTKAILTASSSNQASRDRWTEVLMRPHVFHIKRVEFPGFVDTRMGRPPRWNEDFCTNCYEILPLENTYLNCPGCCHTVESIDEDRRAHNLSLHEKPDSSEEQ